MQFFLLVLFLIPYNLFGKGRKDNSYQPFYSCMESQRSICQPRNYNQLALSAHLSKSQLTTLLQKVYDELYFVGFRYMGHDADLYHGHLIYSDKVHGILYHTQELAAFYEKEDPNHRYSYFDRSRRNWFQFTDERIVDASDFISVEGRLADKYRLFREAYTVNLRMLDKEKLLGSNFEVESLQFSFYKTPCPESEFQNLNILKISNGRSDFCMIVN